MRLRIHLQAAALPLIAFVLLNASTSPATRSFTIQYKAAVSDVPLAAKRWELWLPVPHNDPFQTITDLAIDSPYPYTEAADSAGNMANP